MSRGRLEALTVSERIVQDKSFMRSRTASMSWCDATPPAKTMTWGSCRRVMLMHASASARAASPIASNANASPLRAASATSRASSGTPARARASRTSASDAVGGSRAPTPPSAGSPAPTPPSAPLPARASIPAARPSGGRGTSQSISSCARCTMAGAEAYL